MTPTTNSSNSLSPPRERPYHHSSREPSDRTENAHHEPDAKTRGIIWGVLSSIFTVALVFLLFFQHLLGESFYPWLGLLPGNATLAALAILDNAPIIVRLVAPHTYDRDNISPDIGWPYR
jgi:membrane dipeptidase